MAEGEEFWSTETRRIPEAGVGSEGEKGLGMERKRYP